MPWYCVHLTHSRSFDALNRTFVSLLKSEPRNHEKKCPVYGRAADDGYNYYFSPEAAIQYTAFVKFWGALSARNPRTSKRCRASCKRFQFIRAPSSDGGLRNERAALRAPPEPGPLNRGLDL